jgi:hypothetical protein
VSFDNILKDLRGFLDCFGYREKPKEAPRRIAKKPQMLPNDGITTVPRWILRKQYQLPWLGQPKATFLAILVQFTLRVDN